MSKLFIPDKSTNHPACPSQDALALFDTLLKSKVKFLPLPYPYFIEHLSAKSNLNLYLPKVQHNLLKVHSVLLSYPEMITGNQITPATTFYLIRLF